jgi:hypothetical protein
VGWEHVWYQGTAFSRAGTARTDEGFRGCVRTSRSRTQSRSACPALVEGDGCESDLSKLAFSTLSIHLHSCQRGPPPSTLSSRLPRRAMGPERTRISWAGNPVQRSGEPALSEVERGPAVSLRPHANADKRSFFRSLQGTRFNNSVLSRRVCASRRFRYPS